MRTLVVLSSLVLVAGLSALWVVIADRRAVAAIEPPAPPPILLAEHAREPQLPARPVFRHSVIPGGAYTEDEVEAAMGRDSVVAAHYSGVNPRELRVETLPDDRAVYMSYRIGDEIFWTKQKVRLKQGEPLLTDGNHHIRARCGNCIAFAPKEPTAQDEPGEMEFDTLIGDTDVIESRTPLGSEFLLDPIADISLPWLTGGSSDPRADSIVNDDPPLGVFTPPAFLPPTQSSGDPSDPGKPENPGDRGYLIPEPLENPIVPAPEPGTLLLVGGGLAMLAARRRRR